MNRYQVTNLMPDLKLSLFTKNIDCAAEVDVKHLHSDIGGGWDNAGKLI